MLCGTLHCQKGFNLILFSYRTWHNRVVISGGERMGDDGSHRNAKQFREELVFKAQRLVYHSTLGWRVIKKEEEEGGGGGCLQEGPAIGGAQAGTALLEDGVERNVEHERVGRAVDEVQSGELERAVGRGGEDDGARGGNGGQEKDEKRARHRYTARVDPGLRARRVSVG